MFPVELCQPMKRQASHPLALLAATQGAKSVFPGLGPGWCTPAKHWDDEPGTSEPFGIRGTCISSEPFPPSASSILLPSFPVGSHPQLFGP